MGIWRGLLPGADRAGRRGVKRGGERGLPCGAGASGHPTPDDFGQLEAVWCTTAASCWAVGYYSLGSTDFDQVQRWNGRRWALVPAPARGNNTATHTELTSVTCVSPASCWAAGERSGDLGFGNEVVHWNGHRWSLVFVPDPADSGLSGVSCPARDSCWAVGNYMPSPSAQQRNEVLHWNGRKWSRVFVPSPSGWSQLFGVACPSPDSCWAVGYYFTYVGSVTSILNQMLHWNGRRWSLMATPTQAGSGELTSVSCTSPADCWAVGASGNILGYPIGVPELNQAQHWNGRKWTLVATPDPAGTTLAAINELKGVSCAPAASCWAVGDQGVLNEALRWNGSRWSTR